MAQDEIHVGDIGTIFEVTVKDGASAVDISSATTKDLIFTSPGGTATTRAGSFKTDGTDGILQYTTLTGNIDEVGTWQIQASVVVTLGTFKSDIALFEVHKNL